MKTLLILRHAKSSWKDEKLGDHDRPLNKRGKEDAPHVGEYLRQEELLPDLILSSTAKRAQHTAQLVAEASGYTGEIRLLREFYGAGPDTYLEMLIAIPDEYQCIMIVGHNPGLEQLLDELTGSGERLPTAALAQVELLVEHWDALETTDQGRLVKIRLPKE